MNHVEQVDQLEAFIKDHTANWTKSRIGFHGMEVSMVLWWAQEHYFTLSVRTGIDLKVGVYYGGGLVACAHDVDFGAPLLTRIAARVVDALQIHGGNLESMPLWLQDPVRAELRLRATTLLALANGTPPCS